MLIHQLYFNTFLKLIQMGRIKPSNIIDEIHSPLNAPEIYSRLMKEKERLEAAIEDLKKELRKEKREREGISEEYDCLEQELRENEVRRGEIASYKHKVESLKNDC